MRGRGPGVAEDEGELRSVLYIANWKFCAIVFAARGRILAWRFRKHARLFLVLRDCEVPRVCVLRVLVALSVCLRACVCESGPSRAFGLSVACVTFSRIRRGCCGREPRDVVATTAAATATHSQRVEDRRSGQCDSFGGRSCSLE